MLYGLAQIQRQIEQLTGVSVSRSTVHNWIRSGRLRSTVVHEQSQHPYVTSDDAVREFIDESIRLHGSIYMRPGRPVRRDRSGGTR